MKIYPQENSDGLTALLEATYGSVKFLTEALPGDRQMDIESLTIAADKYPKSVATNTGQPDLHFIETLLVSVGWNLNDDVFDKHEVWAARHSPEDKPFNFQHDEADIIGHIVANHIIDAHLKKISDEQSDPPNDFHIVTSVALYKHWENTELQDRMNSIIADIPEGKWFVSMEALFDDFDYAIIGPDGKHSIVSRNSTSAYLTKHLRAYGGTGKYKDFKVGRLLRNMVFKGEGLVEQPANPKSVILSGVMPFSGVKANRDIILSNEEKSNMSENSNDKLTGQLADAQADIQRLTKELAETGVKQLKEEITSLQTVATDVQAEVEELQTGLATANSELEAKDAQLKESAEATTALQVQLDDVQAEVKLAERVNTLIGAGLSEDDAKKRAEAFSTVGDSEFALIVELTPKAKVVAEVEETVAEVEEDIDVDPAATQAAAEVEPSEDANLSVDESEAGLTAHAKVCADVSAYLCDEETEK